ncbi:hypothetical protein GCM10011581_19760 [Saccharopolyspora subtropica]|uniref:Uncharacterized protein n=1 Tax=Saccharopolyspora thermophila TaxID=89367 RepID=A0A917NC21_9PSEU|nr:hypothetical protein [Saccharopolyspora subtropica]GGI82419.1 hypothetical protein GCM10011581_19760 [Saccharopolyspora subtropica]
MIAKFLSGLPRWRRTRALRSAQLLDDVVDAQVETLPQLPDELRRRHADHLAELVLLAQSYRHYAAGWISRRELDKRGRAALRRMEQCGYVPLVQLTDGE